MKTFTSLLTSALLAATGAALLYYSDKATSAQTKAEFWREMYRAAEHDAQFKNCVDIDQTFVMCKRETP